MRIADAILVADLHLTDRTPVSRTDDYIGAQEVKLKFLKELQEEHNECAVLCAGDVFDYWRASPWLCAWAIKRLPFSSILIPGNHDLPQHSMDEYERSALHVVEQAGKCFVLKGDSASYNFLHVTGAPFGQIQNISESVLQEDAILDGRRSVLMLHELTFLDQKPHWADHAYSAEELLDKFPQFDLIVTGDNHQSFTYEKDGRLLVNPGSMLRRTADQKGFEPVCYLYYADTNTVEAVPFPIENNVHNVEYLERVKERDERVSAYIERIKDNWEVGLSFRDNLLAFFEKNDTSKKVREIIWQHLEVEMT